MFINFLNTLSSFMSTFFSFTIFGVRIYAWIFYPFLIVSVWHAFANKEG